MGYYEDKFNSFAPKIEDMKVSSTSFIKTGRFPLLPCPDSLKVSADPEVASLKQIESLKTVSKNKDLMRELGYSEQDLSAPIQHFESNWKLLEKTMLELERVRSWLASRKYDVPEITESFPDPKRWTATCRAVAQDINVAQATIALEEPVLSFLRYKPD